MTSTNPKHKPLHRTRNIRNAVHNAKQFPQLADYVFNPAHARATVYDPEDPKWSHTSGLGVVAPYSMPPQPTMQQFYTARTTSLNPRPFRSEEARLAQRELWKTAGFVPFVRNGTNQFKKMMKLGLDPRIPPSEEEVRRRAENEARVQEFRDKMTVETIMENSGGGKWRRDGPFPGWTQSLPNQSEVKVVADKKETEKAGAKQKAEAEAKVAADQE